MHKVGGYNNVGIYIFI